MESPGYKPPGLYASQVSQREVARLRLATTKQSPGNCQAILLKPCIIHLAELRTAMFFGNIYKRSFVVINKTTIQPP